MNVEEENILSRFIEKLAYTTGRTYTHVNGGGEHTHGDINE